MSLDREKAEWHVWIRPRHLAPSWTTRALVGFCERRRGTILSPSVSTVLALRRREVRELVHALEHPLGVDREDGPDGIRLRVIREIGDRLRWDMGTARSLNGDRRLDEKTFPEYLIPFIADRSKASFIVKLISRFPGGDRAQVLDPSEVFVYIFLRGSDLSLRDLLMSTDSRICNEELRSGLIEDFREYLRES